MLILVAILAGAPLFSGWQKQGRRDWDQFTFRYETPRLAIVRDHQIPFWNPYTNGGTVLLAHPDCPALSPWYLPVLAFGASLGLRIQVVLFLILGMLGMARLLRAWNVPACGCYTGGVVFMLSSHFVLHIAEGHLEWCVLGLMPWLLLCLLGLARDLRFVIWGGLLLASIMTFGSVYVVAMYVPFLSVWSALESVRRHRWRILFGWLAMILLAALLSAPKLLPQLEFTSAHPRLMPPDGTPPAALWDTFFNPCQAFLYQADRDISNPPGYDVPQPVSPKDALPVVLRMNQLGLLWSWHEYGCYPTYLGLALALLGVAVSIRSHWPLYLVGLATILVILGNQGPIDLWEGLRQLPLYESLRVPSRALAALILVVAAASGLGVSWLYQRACHAHRRRVAWCISGLLPAAITVELLIMAWTLFADVFVCPPLSLPVHEHFAIRYPHALLQQPMMTSSLCPILRSNSGVAIGYENTAVVRGNVGIAGTPGYRGEVYLENPQHKAVMLEWTMARVRIGVHPSEPDRLILNQNYFPGWRARAVDAAGHTRPLTVQDSSAGLVSVEVRPDDREVELFVVQDSFFLGVAISAVTLVVCLIVLGLSRFHSLVQSLQSLAVPKR